MFLSLRNEAPSRDFDGLWGTRIEDSFEDEG